MEEFSESDSNKIKFWLYVKEAKEDSISRGFEHKYMNSDNFTLRDSVFCGRQQEDVLPEGKTETAIFLRMWITSSY